LNKKIGNRWQVSAGAKNILNVTTINSTATAGAHAGGSGLAIGTGRTVFAKLAYTWKEKK
jgi:outer membrane receptor for ferrienterochelin and colicins